MPSAPKPAAPRLTEVATPVGPARLHAYRVRGARAVLALGHGAGRGVDTPDLLGLAAALPAEGVAVVLVDQPWVVASKRVAAPPATLDRAWEALVPSLRRAAGVRAAVPLVVGGRSAGARVAARTSVASGAAGVLLLAFPLLPPGDRADAARRARALGVRAGELAVPLDAGIPVVVAQGGRDAFGTPDDVRAQDPRARVVEVEGGDHSFRVPRSAADPAPVLLSAALEAVRLAVGE